MEKELSEVGLGPDLAWHTSFGPHRLRVYRKVLEEGLLAPTADFTHTSQQGW